MPDQTGKIQPSDVPMSTCIVSNTAVWYDDGILLYCLRGIHPNLGWVPLKQPLMSWGGGGGGSISTRLPLVSVKYQKYSEILK